MSRLISQFLLTLIILTNLFSQTNDHLKDRSEFGFYFGRQNFYQFSEINEDLSRKGIGKIEDNSFFLGLFFRKHFNSSIILGISFNTNPLLNNYTKGDSGDSKFNLIGGSIGLGYDLFNSVRYSLYPMISLGINADVINIKRYSDNEIEWDELYVSNQMAFSEIRTTKLFIKLSLAFEYIIQAKENGLLIPFGIELGTNFKILTIDDSFLYTMFGKNIRVRNFPKLYNRTVFVALKIGFSL